MGRSGDELQSQWISGGRVERKAIEERMVSAVRESSSGAAWAEEIWERRGCRSGGRGARPKSACAGILLAAAKDVLSMQTTKG